MKVIGTAGHVDHGKSALIAALTGTHPDRLKEEQAREMTIDLGFGWLKLPGGEEVGIIDVPGHRDFLPNMLAGVGEIDAVLLVIAADEGVMPQTREHLAILDLLQVRAGLIVLSKVDLIEDDDWLDGVEGEIRLVTAGTTLEGARILKVSSKTGEGLPALVDAIADLVRMIPARPDLDQPRLSIDRVFSMAGFGTVVTGTLLDGRFSTGEDVILLPEGKKSRIRGLQTHGKKLSQAVPGSRTAVNLTGVDVGEIRRGDVLVSLGAPYEPTWLVDVKFKLLSEIEKPLRHSQEVKVFTGAAEAAGRVRVVGREELVPGAEGWLQIEMEQPVVVVAGDRFILRQPSPAVTLGGGSILDAHPAGRHKRFDPLVLQRFEALSLGTPIELIDQLVGKMGVVLTKEVLAASHLDADAVQKAISALVGAGKLIVLQAEADSNLAESYLITRAALSACTEQALTILGAFHAAYPLRQGMAREELKSRLKVNTGAYTALINHWIVEGTIAETNGSLHRPGYEPQLTRRDEEVVQALLKKFQSNPFMPPSVKECQAQVGSELYNLLIERGVLVQVSSEVVYRSSEYDEMLQGIKDRLRAGGKITLAEFRDQYATSRRYAQAFLEYLDAIGLTARVGDAHQWIAQEEKPANG